MGFKVRLFFCWIFKYFSKVDRIGFIRWRNGSLESGRDMVKVVEVMSISWFYILEFGF